MLSSKPYLIRALHEWIVDSEMTPHMLVMTTVPGVRVPEGYDEDGQIILNLSPGAVRNLQLGNDWVSFEARFAGVPQRIEVPVGAVAAIYAQENGEGMPFIVEHAKVEESPAIAADEGEGGGKGKPSLRVVK